MCIREKLDKTEQVFELKDITYLPVSLNPDEGVTFKTE